MRAVGCTILASLALLAAPAAAQKAQDTLRIAINSPFPVLSPYTLPQDEAGSMYREIYETLVSYDEHAGKFVPALAKSWTRISPTILEFELRDDVKFHNGSSFDADDVVATHAYVTDSKAKIIYQTRYSWITQIERLGPHKIRVHSQRPMATDLSLLAYRLQIWDGEALNKLDDKGDYGRLSPIGTGAYKVAQIDRAKGVIIERNDAYNVSPTYRKANIKRIHGMLIPDRETQIAQLITGGIDVIRNASPDTAKGLASNPDVQVTYIDNPTIFYLSLDSTNRSGNKALSDVRVRRAISMAVNRNAIIDHIVPGGHIAERIQALCFKSTVGCKYSVLPPPYDPEGAKKLLAEAGYPNGLEMTYDVYAPNKPIGEAVAGDLLRVGVSAKINPVDIGLYRRKQSDYQLQAWSIAFPTGGHPDADNILQVYFGGQPFEYFNDPIITDGIAAGEVEFDPAKRADIYATVFNRINEMSYILPLTGIPIVYVHSKTAQIKQNKLSVGELTVGDYLWN